MKKDQIKEFAVWAREELISRVAQKAYQYGIEDGSIAPEANSYGGRLLTPTETKQRRELVSRIDKKGYHQVIEEIAYTWFNRFCALRFMEVNGYLPTRVFSSEDNTFQPQILDEALHLDLDNVDMEKVCALLDANQRDELFKYLLIAQCNALSKPLPGMFQKINDATELLFPDNLLYTDSVLDRMVTRIEEESWRDSVQIIGWLYQYYNSVPKDMVFADLKKNIKITKDKIPAATQLFTPDWIVRYMVENSLGRLWVEHNLTNSRGDDDEVPGDLNEALISEWKYYLPEAEQEPAVEAQLVEIRQGYKDLTPEDIKVIDPCMGSGHILVYMFDVLMQIYTQCGYNARTAVRSVLENNLYGLDIDDRAAQLSYFAVMMKAQSYDRRFLRREDNPDPHIYAIQESNYIRYDKEFGDFLLSEEHRDTLRYLLDVFQDAKEYGSILKVEQHNYAGFLDAWKNCAEATLEDIVMMGWYQAADGQVQALAKQAIALSQQYDAVVTNPPYMGSSGMGPKLSEFVKKNYPDTKSDMSTVCMERTLAMCKETGYMAMINIPVWMFLSSYEKLRKHLIQYNTFSTMLHFGRGIFGSDFGTTSFVISKSCIYDYNAIYLKLYQRQGEVESINEKERKFLKREGIYYKKQKAFWDLPGNQIAYWISDKIYDAFAIPREKRVPVFTKSGLTTGDNERFLKLWFEINNTHIYLSKQKSDCVPCWYFHLKGGEFRKWYGNYDFIIHYDSNSVEDMKKCNGFRHDGKEFFFKESITWSKTTAGPLSARINYDNTTFNTAGCCLFSTGKERYTLAALNSKVSAEILSFLCPSLSYAPGDVEKFPILPSVERQSDIEQLTQENIEYSKSDWDSFETSWDFKKHPLI